MKKCYKIPTHTRNGRPVASHIRCRDFKQKKSGNPLEYEGRKLYYEQTKDILEEVDSLGYKTIINQSSSNFGKSEYIYVLNAEDEYNLDFAAKIRISDHGVSNYDRIFNEIHISGFHKITKESLDSIVEDVRFKLERQKYFEIRNFTEKFYTGNIETPTPYPTDKITSERMNKAGTKKIYTVDRVRLLDSSGYFNKLTGKLYSTIR